jgi:type IV secretory pathway protease TraF
MPRRELVKRVAALQDDRLALRGDAPLSTDSRIFGPLPVSAVRWRAIVRYWPLDRIGRLSG